MCTQKLSSKKLGWKKCIETTDTDKLAIMSEELMRHIHGCYDLRLYRVMQRCWSFACQWLWDRKTALIAGNSSITGGVPLLGGSVNFCS